MAMNAEPKALLAAIVGAAALVLVGGILASTTGLLFVAGVTGAIVGLIAAGSSRPKRWIRGYSIGLGVAVVVVGAVGSWLVAVGQGGSLGLFDYLWATSGVLVPFELGIAAAAAAWGAANGPVRG